MFVEELLGAILQLLLFSLIPFIWWLITARKKESFFNWIGIKKIKHEKSILCTFIITFAVVLVYGVGTSLFIIGFFGKVTVAGSNFAGKGLVALPAVLAYGFIRTGLSEEVLFRGFLLKRIGDKFGFIIGNTVQATLFGIMHGIPFGMVTHNILVTVFLTILPGALGWYQGWLNEKRCGGSIISSWLLHGTINVVVACMSL